MREGSLYGVTNLAFPLPLYLFLLEPACYYVYTTNLRRKKYIATVGNNKFHDILLFRPDSLPKSDSNPNIF
jgi:hypothetical protein